MITRHGNLLWLLPLLTLLGAPLWWPLAADLLKPQGDFNSHINNPQREIKAFVMDEVHFSQSKDGREELRLTAKKVSSDDSDTAFQMEGVEAVVGGKNMTSITSNEALYEIKKGILTLMGNVIVKGREGHEMQTSVLRLLTKFKKIKTAAEKF